MAEPRPLTPPAGEDGAFERVRKLVSWIAVSTFVTAFAALLILSATTYWTADNALVLLFDRLWRVSGLVAIALGAIPYARRFVAYLRG